MSGIDELHLHSRRSGRGVFGCIDALMESLLESFGGE
jgi:hypothetical protein